MFNAELNEEFDYDYSDDMTGKEIQEVYIEYRNAFWDYLVAGGDYRFDDECY